MSKNYFQEGVMFRHQFRTSSILRYLVIFSLLAAFTAVPVMASGKININTANSEQLQTLPKVGPKIAEAIIKYRKKHPFKSVDELIEVKGIGEKTLEKLKPLVTVGEKSQAGQKKKK